jgi:hypothetical protein
LATGARLSIIPSTANFAAQYASLNTWPTTPPTLETVMIRPDPAARIIGRIARVTRHTPKKLISMVRRSAAFGICSNVPR